MAMHGSEDSFAPAHQGYPRWDNPTWTETATHSLIDALPINVRAAIERDRQLIRIWKIIKNQRKYPYCPAPYG